MKDEYIIINRTVLEKRIEELDKQAVRFILAHEATICYKKLDELKQILSQSTPLIPEIEKAYEEGFYSANTDSPAKDPVIYISNLKLDI